MINQEILDNNWKKVKEKAKEAALQADRNPNDIIILPVSKTHPPEYIKMGMQSGMCRFGENYAQELSDKHDFFNEIDSNQPEWHFIGHLQRNKVKYIAPFIRMIHSCDSLRLAKEINKQAQKVNRTIDILLQFNTSGERSKFGAPPEEAITLAKAIEPLENIAIKGVMTIGSFSMDEMIYRTEFRLLKEIYDNLKKELPKVDWRHISMGMTHDFHIAIEEGATIIRIGTAIFGERKYNK